MVARSRCFPVFLFVLGIACGSSSAKADIHPRIQASRGSDPNEVEVAPLAVFFDATGTHWDGHDEAGNWQDLHYHWDFGRRAVDPSYASTWARGNQAGRSNDKNIAYGPLAAHVFEAPGSYPVTLTVIDPVRGITARAVTTVHVDDPELVFAGSRTICFSNNDDFKGCPDRAIRVNDSTNWSSVGSRVAPGRRLLLRRGHRWTRGTAIQIKNRGPGTIGAFGAGARPQVDIPGTLLSFDGASDWRIMDLQAVGGEGDHVAFSQSASIRTPVYRILWLRVDVIGNGYYSAFEFGLARLDYMNLREGARNDAPDELFIVGGAFSSHNNVVYAAGRRLALLGNHFGPGGAHGTRITWADRALIQHCNFEGFPRDFEGIKWHASNNFSDVGGGESILSPRSLAYHRFSQRGIISDNVFTRAAVWYVSIGAQNNVTDERLRRFILERNRLAMEGDSNGRVGIWLGAAESVIRENLISGDQRTRDHIYILVKARPKQGLKATRVKVVNNTCYSHGANHDVVCVRFAPDSGDGLAMNNLLYAPGVRRRRIVVDDATGGRIVTCKNCNLDARDNPFAVANPTRSTDFSLAPGGPAVDSGVGVPGASVDFLGSPRTADGDRDGVARQDLGAFELP